jgi:hypothetical protein
MAVWEWGMGMMRVVAGLVVALVGATGAWGQVVHCASVDGAKKYCKAETARGVKLVKQMGTGECKQGESWGYDSKGIWVDRGCDAEFAVGADAGGSTASVGGSKSAGGSDASAGAAGTGASGGAGSPANALPPGTKTLTCSSDGGKIYCDASSGRGVRLVKQISAPACKQDDSWGYDGLGIWVDKGCSAVFALNVPPKVASEAADETGATAKDKTCLAQVGKARAEQMVKQCLKVSPAMHPPCNVQNSCELIEDEIRRSCALLGMEAPGFCGGYK